MPDDDGVQRQSLADAIQCLSNIAALDAGEASEIAGRTLATIIARRMNVPVDANGTTRYPIDIPSLAATKQKGWAKWVIGIDDSHKNGFALEGPFLTVGRRHYLPANALIVHYGLDLYTKTLPLVDCSTVEASKERTTAALTHQASVIGKDWARQLIPAFARYLAAARDAKKESA